MANFSYLLLELNAVGRCMFSDNKIYRVAAFESRIQLFRERLSKRRVRAFATMPKGSMGDIQ